MNFGTISRQFTTQTSDLPNARISLDCSDKFREQIMGVGLLVIFLGHPVPSTPITSTPIKSKDTI